MSTYNLDQLLLLEAINHTGIGVVITNPNLPDNPIIYINKGFEELTGYTREEVIGKNCRFLQGNSTKKRAPVELRQAVHEGKNYETEILNYKKNGEAFWNELNITPIYNTHGKLSYFIGIQKNITVRKQAEETLRLYEKIFEHTMQGIMITDCSTNILVVNDAFTNTTGYSKEEMYGKRPNILSSGKQNKSFYEQLWNEINENGQWKGELWNKKKNGEIYPEFLSISVVKDENEQVTNYVAIFTDITEMKKREKRLAQLSTQDFLTDVANRRKLDQYLEEYWNMCAQEQAPMSFLLLDLDCFKLYNDTYGHQAGDNCLIEVASIIEESVKGMDCLVARYGGEEFAVVLPSCVLDNAVEIAENIRRNIQLKGIQHDQSEVMDVVTVSIGLVTLNPSEQNDVSILIKYADQALYKAKREGKNRVSVLFTAKEITKVQ